MRLVVVAVFKCHIKQRWGRWVLADDGPHFDDEGKLLGCSSYRFPKTLLKSILTDV